MASIKRKAGDELATELKKRPCLDENNNDQSPRSSLSPSLTLTPNTPATSHSPSARRSSRSSFLGRSRTTSRSPRGIQNVEIETFSESEDEDYNNLLERIRSGVKYTRNSAVMQTTRFEFATTSTPCPALLLLRRYGTEIYTSSTHEVYELGIPRPVWVTQGILPGIHDPQWWVNKTLAEIKAGPYADKRNIKRAVAMIKGLQTRKHKKKLPTAREREIEWKLREGTRRQEMGLRMWGADSETHESGCDDDEDEEEEADMPIKRGVRKIGEALWSRAKLSAVVEDDGGDATKLEEL